MPTRCCLLIGDLQLAVPIGYKKERKLREKKLRYRYSACVGACARQHNFGYKDWRSLAYNLQVA
jgi:hypothetical protein